MIASRCGVQPSAIVRFAKSFGFEGASQMQKLFRDGLINTNAALGYSDRVRQLAETTNADGAEPGKLLAEFVEGNTIALNGLLQTVSGDDMARAVAALVEANTVHVVAGFRRSFPVASYLAYSLLQAGKRAVFIDGVGGLALRQVQAMGPDDLLIAVSFQPYAEETVGVVEAAAARGRQGARDQRQPGQPDRQAGRSGAASARIGSAAISARCRRRCASPRRWSSITRSKRAATSRQKTRRARS